MKIAMNLITKNTLRGVIVKLIAALCAGSVIFVAYRLSSKTPSLPFIPLPFSSANEFRRDSFLFVSLEDYLICPEDLCYCVDSEPPTMPFEFRGDKLILNHYLLASELNDWTALRKKEGSTLLYSKYSDADVILQLFSTFPARLPQSVITVLGVNAKGDIKIRFGNDYVIIPVGFKYEKEKYEKIDDTCKIMHAYTFTNYGFIKDENVQFFCGDEY